jgi:hypothetical protein
MYEKCFDVDEIFFFEPKAKKHLPFFSYATKHRKQHFPFFSEALLHGKQHFLFFFVHEALSPFSLPFFFSLAEATILCDEDDFPTYA